jgi:hypothetical protein
VTVSDPLVGPVTTSGSGNFTIDALLAGPYDVTISRAGYATVTIDVSVRKGIVRNIGTITLPPFDSDSDTVIDLFDNCTEVANVDQRDSDGDGFGNACDADLDNNCSVNFTDLGALKAVFFTSDANADLNGDGNVNFVDLGIMQSFFFFAPGPSGLTACFPNG